MNLKLQWMKYGEPVQNLALSFGFASSYALFANPEQALKVDWLEEGNETRHEHNLVILAPGIFGYQPDFTKWDKGDLADGTARYVYPLFNDPSLPFRAGLTIHATKGTWSSLPHEFEREEILTPRPMPFREWFAYVTEEPGGQGVQLRIGHLFGEDEEWGTGEYMRFINDMVTVRDRDIVEIPLGSHPVTALGGTKLGYFWLYTSSGPMAQTVMGMREKFTKDKAL